MSHALFLAIPMLAVFCNLFLFITVLTAKKSRFLYSLLGLLFVLLVMSLGAFFMRVRLFSGVVFWYRVSQAGLAFLPFFYYRVVVRYLGLELRAQTLAYLALTLVSAWLMVFTDIVLYNPVIFSTQDHWYVAHTFRWPSLLLAALAYALLYPALAQLYREGKNDREKHEGFWAMVAGLFVMTIGIALRNMRSAGGFPADTLACALNGGIIYYVLYRRRMSRSARTFGRGAVKALWALVSLLAAALAHDTVSGLFDAWFFAFSSYKAVAVALFFAVAVPALYLLLLRLYGLLFEKERILRSMRLKEFSLSANKTLNRGDLVNTFSDFILQILPFARAYVFLPAPGDNARLACAGRSAGLDRRMEFEKDSPLMTWLRDQTGILTLSELTRSPAYGMATIQETRMLGVFNAELILPLNTDGALMGFVLLSKKTNRRKYTASELGLLDAALPVFSIALRNAALYEKINREAQLDPLTGLYNRRYFIEKLESDLRRANGGALSVALFNLDDLRLYDEAQSSEEGEAMLSRFASILKGLEKPGSTLAHFGCNEFAVILPTSDAKAAIAYAHRVKARLAEHLGASYDPTMFLAFAAGVCSCPSGANDAKKLLSGASLAVRRAKSGGESRIVAYAPELLLENEKRDRATIIQEYASTIYALTAAIDTKDHYTFNHSLSVSHYAASLAKAADMDNELVEAVRQAGLLHDIGKLAIPDAILSKAGKLTEEEFSLMRKHVESSVEMIRRLPSLGYVIPLVLGHHERYDGGGYPRAIAGPNIPLGARCLTIADSFDAMISQRSYKNPMPLEDALNEIRLNLGRQFDPSLGRLFISMVESGELNVACY